MHSIYITTNASSKAAFSDLVSVSSELNGEGDGKLGKFQHMFKAELIGNVNPAICRKNKHG